jgi:hypothetical protein
MALFYTPTLPPSGYQYNYLYQQLQKMTIVLNEMNSQNSKWHRMRAKDFYIASIAS